MAARERGLRRTAAALGKLPAEVVQNAEEAVVALQMGGDRVEGAGQAGEDARAAFIGSLPDLGGDRPPHLAVLAIPGDGGVLAGGTVNDLVGVGGHGGKLRGVLGNGGLRFVAMAMPGAELVDPPPLRRSPAARLWARVSP